MNGGLPPQTIARRIPQPGDSYWKHGYEFCRVAALDCYGRVFVCFYGWPERSAYTVAEFHRLIEQETWGRA